MARTPRSPAAGKPRATTRKPAAPRARAGESAPEPPPESTPAPVPAPETAPILAAPILAVVAPQLRKRDLVERVVARSGAKKKDVKPVVEATLAVLGEALAAGEELNLPPLGKAKINRRKDTPNGAMMVIRLRRGGGEDKTKEPLADEAE